MKLFGRDGLKPNEEAKILKKDEKSINPFDHGLRSNCVDFWTNGDELGVDYMDSYDVSMVDSGGCVVEQVNW